MKPLHFILFYLGSFALFGQQSKVDSLNPILQEYLVQNKYAEQYTIYVGLLEAYIVLEDTEMVVNTMIDMAEASRGGGSLAEALNLLADLEALPYTISPKSRVAFYLVKGSIVYEISDHQQAISLARKGLKEADRINYHEKDGLLYNLLGGSYANINSDSAIYFIESSITHYFAIGDTIGVALPYINMSRLYMDKKDLDKAISVLYNVLDILEKEDIPIYRKMTYAYLGMLYIDKKEYENAVKYIELRDSVNFEIYNSEVTFQINQFQDRLKKEEQENQVIILNGKVELAQYENRSKTIFILIGLVMLVILGLMLFFAVKSANTRKEVNILIAKKAKELEELNMFKNKVISVISHDMRTPLAQIITLHQAKNSGISFSDTELKEMERTILASTKSGLLILDNLLKWAKSQLDGLDITKEAVNSSMLLSHILNQVSQLAKEKQIQLDTSFADVIVNTDEGMFEIIMRNVLSNAIKFSPSGSVIKIASLQIRECLVIKVVDQGPGISDSVLEKLKSKDVIKPKPGSFGEKGAGIGLAFSLEFSNKIGGSLQCKRLDIGGTEAMLVLPTMGNKAGKC